MHADRIPGESPNDARSTPVEEGYVWQGRVLAVLFLAFPRHLTELELVRELAGKNPTSAQKDAITRALEVVIEADIAHRCESLIVLTKLGRHIAGAGRK
jgi:hypothetical protein